MNWSKLILETTIKNHEVYCMTNDIEVERKPINRYAIYNTYIEELEGTGTFDTVEEAKEFMSDHRIGQDVDGKQIGSFTIVELKRV